MHIYCFQLSKTDPSHTPLILFIYLKHLKRAFAKLNHVENHVICYMRIVTCYTYTLYLFFIYLSISLSLSQFVVGLSLTLLSNYTNLFTIPRNAVIHQLMKQISYCYNLLSDILQVVMQINNKSSNFVHIRYSSNSLVVTLNYAMYIYIYYCLKGTETFQHHNMRFINLPTTV